MRSRRSSGGRRRDDLRARHRSGHHRLDLPHGRGGRTHRRARVSRDHPALSPAGLGRARCERDPRAHTRRRARCRKSGGRDTCRHRHHQQARAERALGPVGRAIVWQDRRTAARCAELSAAAERIGTLTGLVIDPYFSATKLEWMLRDASLRGRAERGELAAGTIDSWLIWNLTGGEVHATDPTNASRTQLFDIERLSWSDELCELFHVPRSLLPEVRPSSGDFGHTKNSLFDHPVPIAGVAGDQQAALFGQGCWGRGDAKCTYGTGAFLLLNTGPKRPARSGGLLTTIGCDATGGAVYALEAAIFIAGAAVQWLRDELGIIEAAADTERLARSIESTGGVYFVPALVGLGAPHWEPRARGVILGITRGTNRAHLARAALE